MSYDLHIWSRAAVALPQALPDAQHWSGSGDTWVRAGRGWQLTINPSLRVLPEDIPPEVDGALPGIAFQTEINLSPISAPESARRVAVRTAGHFAKIASGIVHDPQTNTLTTPRGTRRLESLGANESAGIIAMSWWFVRGPLVDADAADLTAALEGTLPEALPRRYGIYEPPQYLYAETGREHFLGFVREHGREGVVWYPHAPIALISLSIPPQVGASRLGFRCGRLTIEADEDALRQPGWTTALQRSWRKVSHAVQPFYGDVRRLGGYVRRRGRYWHNAKTEEHPVCAWWWAGIPAGPVYAAVLGDPYTARWPSFCASAESDGALWFVSTPDWRTAGDALGEIGGPPRTIEQPAPENRGRNDRRRYPPDWPFGPPRTEGRVGS